MAKASKQKSLAALAKSLDTRKQPLPAKTLGAAQRRVLERAVRPEVRPRIEAALARQPLASGAPRGKASAPRASKAPVRAPAPRPLSRAVGAKSSGAASAKAASAPLARDVKSSSVASVKAAAAPLARDVKSSIAASLKAAPAASSRAGASAPVAMTRPGPAPVEPRATSSASTPRAASTSSFSSRDAAPIASRAVTAPSSLARPAAAASSTSSSRASALSSLQRTPSPAPTQLPGKKATAPAALATGDARRRYPRAEVHVRASLALADDPSRVFEASLPTVNLSVGGLFLESSFFLKVGTRLLVTLQLPRQGREVKVKGEVVRLESNADGQSGFALRFTEYLEGSQVVLATHFLSPVLREFLSQYAKEHLFEAGPEYLAHTADVLAAWELKKAELGGDVWALFSSGE